MGIFVVGVDEDGFNDGILLGLIVEGAFDRIKVGDDDGAVVEGILVGLIDGIDDGILDDGIEVSIMLGIEVLKIEGNKVDCKVGRIVDGEIVVGNEVGTCVLIIEGLILGDSEE